jgi:nitroreductase
MNQIIDIIQTRRSVRKYQDKKIEQDKLKAILQAGQYAPSGSNRQYNHFIVIQNKEIIEKINALATTIFSNMEVSDDMYTSIKSSILQAKQGPLHFTYNASVFIIIANKKEHGNAMADSACAIENMMLAAHALDLGTCYINQLRWLHDNPTMLSYLHTLGLEADEIPQASLIVGYSAEEPEEPLPRHGNIITYVD